ncbi:MAG TPA: flagellar basal body rod protein FlgC [Longimicrobiaceae bacterium]
MSNVPGFPAVPGYTPLVRPMFRTLAIAASGLSAQRMRLEVTAENVANAETTRGPDGAPYRRRVVRMEAQAYAAQPYEVVPPGVDSPLRLPSGDPMATAGGVRVAAVEEDASEGPLVYDPGHPDANGDGYVRYPNVRITDEMVELMDARRVYEANATVFQSAKSMLRRAIDI